MKVTIPLGVLVLAVLLGYLLGTEAGRVQRDVILVKLGRKEAEGEATDAETAAPETA